MERTDRTLHVAQTVVMIIITACFTYPLIWLLINSLKTDTQLFTDPWGLADPMQFSNYAAAWKMGRIGTYLQNSLFVSALSVVICILASTMASYAITRMKWRLSSVTLKLFLLGIMVPIYTSLIPLFMMFSRLQLVNTHISLILPYTGFALPTSIFILTAFMSAMPRDLEEAAVIDGCSIKRSFFHVVLPLVQSAIATVTIFNFISIWNELIFAVVFLSDSEKMTLPVGLINFSGRYSTAWTYLLAAIVISIIPSIIVYIVLHDKIIKGALSGAVKG